MKNSLLIFGLLVLSVGLCAQNNSLSKDELMKSISNLNPVLVEIIETKVESLSETSKKELMQLAEFRNKVNSGKMSLEFHKRMEKWMNANLTKEELNTYNSSRPVFSKGN